MGSCRVHNIRFYDLEPRAINCMAYDDNCRKLALSRDDNSIEVWDVKYTPHIELTIAGHPGASVESLVWNGGRLFGAGLQGFVMEFDLTTLSIKSSVPVIAGACWCLDITKCSRLMAAGTEEGYINILKLNEDGIVSEKILDKQEGRIFCLAWDPSEKFIASGSVGAVRVWSVETGHALHRMTTGKATNAQDTLVWGVAFTGDFTVISGDSRGKISIWDAKIGCCIKSFHSHKADVLTVCLSEDENSFYSAGIDPLIINYERIDVHHESRTDRILGHKAESIKTWVRSFHRRLHDHDVRVLVAGRKNQLFSGGVDGYLGISSYPPKVVTRYPPLPQGKGVHLAPKARCVLLRYLEHLELWRLGTTSNFPDDDEKSMSINKIYNTGQSLPLINAPSKEVELRSKDGQPITECAMSDDARWIAFSTPYYFTIYQLQLEGDNTDITMKEDSSEEGDRIVPLLQRVTGLLPQIARNATGPIAFSSMSDQTLCFVSTLESSPKINIIGLVDHECGSDSSFDITAPPSATLLQTIDLTVKGGLTGKVHLLTVSKNGQYLGVADINKNVAVWDSEHWKIDCCLPKHNCKATAMAIHPETNNLVVVYPDHEIVEWSLESKKYTKFCRRLQNQGLPNKWLSSSFTVQGILFDAKKPDVIIFYDDSTITILDKSKVLSQKEAKIPKVVGSSPENNHQSDDQRSTANESLSHAFHFIKKYKHLVHVGWVGDGELVAVEVSPTKLLESLPPSMLQKKYGR